MHKLLARKRFSHGAVASAEQSEPESPVSTAEVELPAKVGETESLVASTEDERPGNLQQPEPPRGIVREMRRQTVLMLQDSHGATNAFPLVTWEETSREIDRVRYLATKRIIDIVGASIGFVLLSPLMLLATFFVWLQDGSPVMFRQTRVGLHGRRFHIYKIRTMVRDAESRLQEVAALNQHEDQRTFKAADDPRILKIGKLLRKYSIDEFPQLYNVLRGEMSLVGPRPPIPHEVELYDPEDYVRLAVKPGLTCYWQIAGRGTIAFKGQVELDR